MTEPLLRYLTFRQTRETNCSAAVVETIAGCVMAPTLLNSTACKLIDPHEGSETRFHTDR